MLHTSTLITAQQRYEVAYWLERMESPSTAADRVGVPLEAVRELGHSIGWPANEKRMRSSVTQLGSKPGVHPVNSLPLDDDVDEDTAAAAAPQTTVPSGSPTGPSLEPPLTRPVDGETPLGAGKGGSPLPRAERRFIPVADLRPDPDNPRDHTTTDEDLPALADSIRQVGLLQDIVARQDGDRVIVVAGHRRLAAVRSLGWELVPVLVHEAMSRDQVLAAMLSENSHRKDLDPILQAHAVEQLRVAMGGENVSHQEVAAKLGRTQVWVSERLSLLALNREDQARVRRGDMTLGEAVRTARLEKGTARAKRPGTRNHLANLHPLAHHARNRCDRLGHPRGARVGAVACGECWEQVIRANERQDATADSYQRGVCVCCQQPMPKRSTGSGEQL